MTDQKEPRKQVRLSTLKKMHENGEPIVMLTCYDASFAHLLDEAGVDMLLVGRLLRDDRAKVIPRPFRCPLKIWNITLAVSPREIRQHSF